MYSIKLISYFISVKTAKQVNTTALMPKINRILDKSVRFLFILRFSFLRSGSYN